MQRYSAVSTTLDTAPNPVAAQDTIPRHTSSSTASDSRPNTGSQAEPYSSASVDTIALQADKDLITGWPSGPQTLNEATPSWSYRLLPHYVLIIVPVVSIGLGISVLSYNNKAESDGGDITKQAMAVTATLWPILFAATLGTMLKAAVLFWAQRGARLGVLETLHSSQTLASTLRTCYMLRIFSVWPILLILVWSLSPVGGQGALRAMNLRNNTTIVEYRLANYPKSDLSAHLNGLFDSRSGQASDLNQYRALVGAVFSALDIGLMQANGSSDEFERAVQRAGGEEEAVRITKRDLWRNVRVPLIHMLPTYDQDITDWIEVPPDAIPEYSSLIGTPIRGYPSAKAANTSFVVQTNYQTLKCGDWLDKTAWFQDQNHNDSLVLQNQSAWYSWINPLEVPNIWLDMVEDKYRTKQVAPWTPAISNGRSEARDEMKVVFYTSHNLTLCTVSTEYVDSLVECSRATQNTELACSVRKMRYTPDHNKSNLTALDFGMTRYVLKDIPFTIASSHSYQPSTLEKWLRNPSTSFDSEYEFSPEWFAQVPMNVLSNRLTMVLNTNILAMFNGTIMVGGDAIQDEKWGNTTGTWTEYTAPVYSINKTWFSLYFVSAFVLLICAVANIVLRSLIYAPDFFGSISAMTRDSPFFDVPTPASGMDGTERSRLLQDKWVRIQDVSPEKGIGRIALSDSIGLVPLQKSRMYS